MIDNASEATSSGRETSVFRGDPEKAAQAQARAWRIVFWIDTVFFLTSLFFLFCWMFELGYLPGWAVLSQLFFISAIISFTQRRLLRFSSEKLTFVITVADTGIIIEDPYTREVIEKSRLQAIIPAASRGLFTINPLSLVIDNKPLSFCAATCRAASLPGREQQNCCSSSNELRPRCQHQQHC
ncbi:MAG: hypothetical protein A2W80_04125 [Candidatus Riflebacteria bacterium GWC2_50_8]|nr:MAG: hypothetical protein A2W80_04125 [Candidatus Riflebacteria bacterium GWC2_50_8]